MAPTQVTDKQVSDARLLLSWGVVQAILGDKRASASKDLVDVLERNVYSNLLQCEEWSAIFLKDLVDENKDVEQIHALNEHMKDYLTQSFRQKYVSLSSTEPVLGKPYSVHISVIRRLNPVLSRSLRLEGTTVLDRLYECDVLSETDRHSILAQTTDKRKNEAFLSYLCSNFTTETFTETVLPILSEDEMHTGLAEKIKYEIERESAFSGTPVCTSCKMKGLADPRKLSEALYELSAISESFKHDLCLSTQPMSTRWEDLFSQVGEVKLLQALQMKYPHLYWEFKETDHTVFACCCYKLARTDVAMMSDFTSDYMNLDESDISTLTGAQDDYLHDYTSLLPLQRDLPSSSPLTSQESKPLISQMGFASTYTSLQKNRPMFLHTRPSDKPLITQEEDNVSSKTYTSLQETKPVFQKKSPKGSFSPQEDKESVTPSEPAVRQGAITSFGKTDNSNRHGSDEKTGLSSRSSSNEREGQTTNIHVDKGTPEIKSSPKRHSEPQLNISIPTEYLDIQNDKAELHRLEKEYHDTETHLKAENSQVKMKEHQEKLSRLKRLIGQRKQLLALSEERKEKATEIRARIAELQQHYDQENVLFQKVSASRMLEVTRKELEKAEEDYVEKRRKIESACVLM